ncbi:hypothetical protein IU433_05385 [Nocardia puris]|uniref:Uncharacterized protein n=1 Tax=Nocardia puris TaxID=208602 RepID=A0A366E3Y6_9NOCA|nr:hypothetical protein [Nocardia puris]MBF6209615.1 hypothetical protein [Nocardia puris]MBF6366187.1 hypothetical protein [Nocardia puris]MBF6458474.1 hypothetical protein [Nocardia puris]RBO96118.1 hypothetical protein DFR74_101129 [Nocardia puris]
MRTTATLGALGAAVALVLGSPAAQAPADLRVWVRCGYPQQLQIAVHNAGPGPARGVVARYWVAFGVAGE